MIKVTVCTRGEEMSFKILLMILGKALLRVTSVLPMNGSQPLPPPQILTKLDYNQPRRVEDARGASLRRPQHASRTLEISIHPAHFLPLALLRHSPRALEESPVYDTATFKCRLSKYYCRLYSGFGYHIHPVSCPILIKNL